MILFRRVQNTKLSEKLEQIWTVTVDFQIGQKEATCGGLEVHWR